MNHHIKKIKSKFNISFLKSSWIAALTTGIVIGVVSQRIPQIKAYTDEVIQSIELKMRSKM